jgi:hypothetical protein
MAGDLDALRAGGGADDLDPATRDRMAALENALRVDDSDEEKYRGLYPDAADGAWSTARQTGDVLADYWEYRASRGLDIDLDLKAPPPRSEWSKE